MMTHTGERPFACDECDKAYLESANLRKHKKLMHPEVLAHACKKCDKRFPTASALDRHSVIHKGNANGTTEQLTYGIFITIKFEMNFLFIIHSKTATHLWPMRQIIPARVIIMATQRVNTSWNPNA